VKPELGKVLDVTRDLNPPHDLHPKLPPRSNRLITPRIIVMIGNRNGAELNRGSLLYKLARRVSAIRNGRMCMKINHNDSQLPTRRLVPDNEWATTLKP
jgi:hypothetical protein